MNEWVTVKTFFDRNEALGKLSLLHSQGICAKLCEDETAKAAPAQGLKLQVMDDSIRKLEISILDLI